jgi:hypothetical protein
MNTEKKLKFNFKEIYTYIIEKIQLTIFYYFSFVSLLSITRPYIFTYNNIIPNNNYFLHRLLKSRTFKILLLPEASILFYFLSQELFIRRNIMHTSLLVKFNITLICIISMIISLIISYWDLFFIKSTKLVPLKTKMLRKPIQNFYFSLFCIFTLIYFYLYIFSLFGKYPKLPGISQNIIDAAFFSVNTKKFKE